MIVWNEFRNDARVLKEAQTLARNGYKVTVFALHTPNVTRRKEVLEEGLGVERVLRSPFWRLRGKGPGKQAREAEERLSAANHCSRIRRLGLIASRAWTHAELLVRIVLSRPDVVHSHDVNTLPTGWLAAVVSRARLVYDAHEISTDREGYAGYRRLVGFVEARLMPKAHGTITTTEARARFFARAYGVGRPLVLQNRPRYSPVGANRRLRQELGIDDERPIVLYQGGLQQGRGLELLVCAAEHVSEAVFVFIGGGRLEPRLRALVSRLGLEERVRFVPTVSLKELGTYTASADIGVQPIENTCLNHLTTDSNKLFEYIAAGLPVIASDLPEIRRVIGEHDLGLLVRSGDLQELVAAIRTLSGDEALRQRLGNNARHAATILNWEAQESSLLELYERVLPGRGREGKRSEEAITEPTRR